MLSKWRDISIRAKSFLLMGIILVSMWTLVVFVILQLHEFNRKSDVIMNDYMDITGFLDSFSAENVALEAYIRPTASEMAQAEYLSASRETDLQLRQLQPNLDADPREEYVLKWAIQNAMEHYRKSQAILLGLQEQENLIPQYLSMKAQSAYIDGYTRDLLHCRMIQGGKQWEEIEAANTRSIQQFIGFLTIITLLVVVMLFVLSYSVLRPLAELGRAADRLGNGQYDSPPLEVRGNDEIGRVARSFNLMQAEIRRTIQALEKQSEMEKHLLEKEVEAAQMQRMLQEGRFAQLQSQINPHFLFNTLSTIAALAREEGAPLSEDLILRLSSFFRYSLESGEKFVTLGKELELLRDYMALQDARCGDRIRMEIHSDPALEGVPVPKFILQPLVENAILHGLRDCVGGGSIQVLVSREVQGVMITVTDNGCGFDPSDPPKREKHHSVGLNNIAERMELSGGHLEISSAPGDGTTVRILTGRSEL